MNADKILLEAVGVKKYFTIRHSLIARKLAGRQNLLVRAVDGVDLTILQGETLGLVGESGCGKSTLGRAILAIHPLTAGRIYFQGEDIGQCSQAGLLRFREKAQIIFQNPYASLNPRKTVRDILSVPLMQKGIRHPLKREELILQLLERVGLSPYQINCYPTSSAAGSGRIGIAGPWPCNLLLLFATNLFPPGCFVQAQIINLLEELQQELKLTYLFISHDLSVIYYVSSRVAVIYLGKIVEVASTEALSTAAAPVYGPFFGHSGGGQSRPAQKDYPEEACPAR